MTRQPAQLPDPREDEVRRLLADARHVEPVPVDVAARLDRVLAQLAAGEDGTPSTVSELAVRRRRRAARLLAAAAAVTVVGLGLGQVLPGGGGADSAGVAGSAGSAADGQAADDVAAEESATASDETELAAEPLEGMAGSGATALQPAPDSAGGLVDHARPARLRPERFAADALRARNLIDGDRRASGSDRAVPRARKQRATFFECTPAAWGEGVAVPVLYDGRPHVLVFRAPAGDTQVADLLQCGTGDILRSTTLPAG